MKVVQCSRLCAQVELIKETVASPAEEVLHGFIKEISKTGGVIRCWERGSDCPNCATNECWSPSECRPFRFGEALCVSWDALLTYQT